LIAQLWRRRKKEDDGKKCAATGKTVSRPRQMAVIEKLGDSDRCNI
jgi:hypothetical protein